MGEVAIGAVEVRTTSVPDVAVCASAVRTGDVL